MLGFLTGLRGPSLLTPFSTYALTLTLAIAMPSPERSIIREVWAENLDQEMALLRELVDHYPYLAMVCP